MLLKEIASVTDISSAREKRKEREKQAPKAKDSKMDKPKTFDNPDKIGSKRRDKLSQADQFRDIARMLRNKDK